MASSAGPTTLPHRAVTNIRGGTQPSAAVPQTPTRPLSASTFGSPSGVRADDDTIVIELGSRKLRLGWAGDNAAKRIVAFSPDQHRRAGDFKAWDPNYAADWRGRASGKPWGADYELWQLDVRGQDVGLVEDKLERELRDAFFRYLLIDSRPRKISLVLPPTMPLPLLSSTLDTLMDRLQAPTVSLLSSPVMTAMAAGLRSSLVIDLGWHETTITAVYEYREVQTWRTIRAGKYLVEETFEFLSQRIQDREAAERHERTQDRLADDAISFEECEEVATRLLWCKKAAKKPRRGAAEEGLTTVHEDEEIEEIPPTEDQTAMPIMLMSCRPPRSIHIPFSRLAEPCETTFFDTRISPSCFDDHELPVHLLVHRALLQLPMDVRAVCMSRIIFTGGCSNIVGLRSRIFDEVSVLAEERGWDAVSGKAYEQLKSEPHLRSNGSVPTGGVATPSVVIQPDAAAGERETPETPLTNAAHAPQEVDQVEKLIRKERNYKAPVEGDLRVVESLGPWCGASLATQLKIPALATIERELWISRGINGASHPNEVDVKTSQRQSMGPNGLIRGQTTSPNSWTLGIWGALV
ncbi:actin-domain-containing protein [Xylariaceae sp. FL1019]|nr:actin-domain-containing protein [Xylariaceae sp. FL1019]